MKKQPKIDLLDLITKELTEVHNKRSLSTFNDIFDLLDNSSLLMDLELGCYNCDYAKSFILVYINSIRKLLDSCETACNKGDKMRKILGE